MRYCLENSNISFIFLHTVVKALFVKFGVEGVEVLFIELVGEQAQIFAETLIVNNLTLTQKAYSVLDVVVVAEAQNVVVGRAGFLLPDGINTT